MDALIEYFQGLDSRLFMILASIIFLWMFASALRGLIKFALFVTMIFVVVWKVPAVQDVFVGFIK